MIDITKIQKIMNDTHFENFLENSIVKKFIEENLLTIKSYSRIKKKIKENENHYCYNEINKDSFDCYLFETNDYKKIDSEHEKLSEIEQMEKRRQFAKDNLLKKYSYKLKNPFENRGLSLFTILRISETLLLIEPEKEKTKEKKNLEKPRTLHNQEIYSKSFVELKIDESPTLFDKYDKEQINEFLNKEQFLTFANSHGFLVDGILKYINLYKQDNKIKNVKIIERLERDKETKEKLENYDLIRIEDTFQNFCKYAGVENTKQKKILLEDLKSNFRKINIYQKTKNYAILANKPFLNFDFERKISKKKSNLKYIKDNKETDIIILKINKDIFEPILTYSSAKGTLGYYIVPELLEKNLRDTVKRHELDLIKFCKENNFKYFKGGAYISSIRPLFNLLIREEKSRKDQDGYLIIQKPIKNYACICCDFAFFNDKKGNRKFKKAMAIESLKYSFEVLKYLYNDGIKRIEINDYFFDKKNIFFNIKHHFSKKKLQNGNEENIKSYRMVTKKI